MSEIRANQAAFLIDDAGRVEFCIPTMEPKEVIPPPYLVVLALASMANDPSWIYGMIEKAHELATSIPAPEHPMPRTSEEEKG